MDDILILLIFKYYSGFIPGLFPATIIAYNLCFVYKYIRISVCKHECYEFNEKVYAYLIKAVAMVSWTNDTLFLAKIERINNWCCQYILFSLGLTAWWTCTCKYAYIDTDGREIRQ